MFCQAGVYTILITQLSENIINTEIMWLNSHIKVDRRPICNMECIDSNLWRLEQLYEQNDLLDCNLIKYHLRC